MGMDFMFRAAGVFNQNINGWNVAQVTGMNHMFYKAVTFNQNINGWNVAQVKDMSYMFYSAEAFNQNINGWNVAQVTGQMAMFMAAGCDSLETCGGQGKGDQLPSWLLPRPALYPRVPFTFVDGLVPARSSPPSLAPRHTRPAAPAIIYRTVLQKPYAH